MRYSNHYGADVKTFLTKYYPTSGIDQALRIRRNIIGKTAIMEGFSDFLQDVMSPTIINLAGRQLGINEYRNHPQVWSEKNINFAFSQIFEKLINPEKDGRDPTLDLVQVYTGNQQANLYQITAGNLGGTSKPFWLGSQYGKLPLTSATLTHYFGNDYYTIQPSLYYRYYNINSIRHSDDLSLQYLLTSEFKGKIQHLFTNFYSILSENYQNGDEITATFHVEKSLGFGEKSKMRYAFTKYIRETKFGDLIGDKNYLLKFSLNKQGSEIINDFEFREFVASIALYMVMFNAFVFIGDKDAGFSLFATQRKLYDNEYIRGLYTSDVPTSRLSSTGQQIYNTWGAKWNEDTKTGRTIWNYEDCWPIYLLDDARGLIDYFEDRYRITIQGLDH